MQKIGTGIYLKKENKIKTIWKRIQQKQNKNMPEKKKTKKKEYIKAHLAEYRKN